jgi:hypothetical protein
LSTVVRASSVCPECVRVLCWSRSRMR